MFTDQERQMWKNAKSLKLPDGIYTMVLKRAGFRTVGETEDKKMLLLEWEVLAPESQQGRKYTQWMSMGSESQCFFSYQNLELLGVNVDCELDVLDGETAACNGTEVEMSLFTKGQYQNPKLLNVIKKVHNGEAAKSSSNDEDIPF